MAARASGDLKDKVKDRANGQMVPATNTIKSLLAQDKVKARFTEILGKKAPGFISSLLTVSNGNRKLLEADPWSIISTGAIAAALDLPVDPNLGFAHIVPYKGKAQFQMGYKGYIQLAMRTGQYRTINACEVYEGEIANIDRFTGEVERGEKTSDKVVGFIAYFKLINGFEKYLFMTSEEIDAHARKYSQSYSYETSRWKQDFHAMAIKTVLKRLLSKYGILSIEMQTGLQADQAVVRDDEGGPVFEYPDGTTLDAEYTVGGANGEVQEEQGQQGA